MKMSKKVFILLVLCLLFSWLLAGSSVMAQEKVMKLTLTFDKTKLVEVAETGRAVSKDPDTFGTKIAMPPEILKDLINLKSMPLIDVAEIAKNGGKELAAEIKTLIAGGYNFYQVELGVNLGPSEKYKFIEANLTYQLPSENSGDSCVKVFDIFPQTTYDEILKISGKVGLDLSLGYKVPTPVPAGIDLKASFVIEPKPWVWKVATIQSTGKYTSRAGWIFKVGEKTADLQTQMILMSKLKPPFAVNIEGWVKISPGAWHSNYYYNINSVNIKLDK